MNACLQDECEHLLRLVQAEQKVSRNLDGVIAPGVFIDIVRGGSLDERLTWTQSEVNGCISKAFDFVRTTGCHVSNPYHNFAHSCDVYVRVSLLVLAKTIEETFAANYSAVVHDYDHPGNLKSCGVELGEIYEAYEGKYSMDDIRWAYEKMFELDNALITEENSHLPKEKQKPLRELFNSSGRIPLTPEEISGFWSDGNLVVYGDAIGKPTPLLVRALSQGLIKASDFSNKRNFPKTPLEWQFKMADMANFVKPLSRWLVTAVKVGLEAPWGLPANVEKFVDGEIFFLEKMVREPILKNPEAEGLFPSWLHVALQEKVTYLLSIKNEVERMKMGLRSRAEASHDLGKFLEVVKPLFPQDEIPLF